MGSLSMQTNQRGLRLIYSRSRIYNLELHRQSERTPFHPSSNYTARKLGIQEFPRRYAEFIIPLHTEQ